MRLLWRINLSYLRHHPWQSGLAIFGIALGIAVVIAVQIAQRSARVAFDAAQNALTGGATHRIETADGMLPDVLFGELCRAIPHLKATPVLEIPVRAAVHNRWLTWVGLEPFSALAIRAAGRGPPRMLELLRDPAGGFVNASTLRQLGVADGSTVEFAHESRKVRLAVRRLDSLRRPSSVPADVLLSDIATVQDATGTSGSLSYIDLMIPDDADGRRQLAALRNLLGTRFQLRDIGQEQSVKRDLSKAFDTNLAALSLLALLVGMFLVYNTETFLIAQRRELYARLRAIGVTPRELFHSVLFESACLGAVASAAGAASGLLLASTLLEMIARTVNSFYYPVDATSLATSPWLLAIVWGGGTGATMLSAMPAAIEAARTLPAGSRQFARARQPASFVVTMRRSAVALAVALALHVAHPGLLWLDFLVFTLGLLAFALLVPPALRAGSTRLADHWLRNGPWPEQVGVDSLRPGHARTAIAATALCLATAVSLGMLLMTASFRAAVDRWLQDLLMADAYISVQAPRTPGERALLELKIRLEGSSTLRAVSSVTRREISNGGALLQVAAYDLPAGARAGFRFLAGDPASIWSHWQRSDVVIVSESYAFRHGLQPGEELTIATPRGPIGFRVGGVYRDFASEHGTVAMSTAVFHRYWPRHGVSGIGVYLNAGASLEDVNAEVMRLTPPGLSFVVRSNREIRQISLGVFDQTFAITRVLGAIALGVSLVGITGALLAQQLDRAREYSVLRAMGSGRRQIFRIVLAQTLMIGGVAATLAVPLGIACAWYLVRVVNLHAFGWTMPLTIPADIVIGIWLAVLAAAALAAVYPALRAIRIPPARALRYE